MAEVLRENGWNTFWVGKNHNVPVDEWAMGASKRNWPLARGFDRFYGFIGGETNNWYPNLVEDNHYVDQPYLPEEGYHLSKDLADKAISYIADSKQSAPDKPWFLWFCPGANHAPHHCPQDYIEKYQGQFDDGYEAYREWALPRMIERGILPKDTELTPINPLPESAAIEMDYVRPWDSLNEDEKRLFARMAEVYAGFSEYTDAQVGRIIDYLEESGQLENTLIMYCADNGASGEGSPNGSVNENICALYGIVGAVLISVLTLLFQLSRRPLEIVEAVPSPGAAQISIPDAMLLVRPRSDIFFANIQHFRRDLYAALAARDPKPSIVLIDASRRCLFEFTAHQIVRDMVADLRAQGLEIWVVLPRGEAGEAISRFRDVFGPAEAQPFPTISDAIEAHLDQLDGSTD